MSDPRSSLSRQPNKSILKRPSQDLSQHTHDRHQTYDEENVKETYGPGLDPKLKDYGHDKIDEAKTPYIQPDGSSRENPLDNAELLNKINQIENDPADRRLNNDELVFSAEPTGSICVEDNDFSKHDAERPMSSEEKIKKAKFDNLRKQHYKMKEQMALARKMMAEEEEEDEEEDDE